MPEIVELLASPVHRFEGRPADGPAPAPEGELVEEVRIRAGLGIVGDRQWALFDLGTGFGLTARRVPDLLFAAARLRRLYADLTVRQLVVGE